MKFFVGRDGDLVGWFVIDIEVQLNQESNVHEEEGSEPEMVANTIRFLVVHSEKFDFGEDGDVVKGPVTEVAGTGEEFQEISEGLFFREEDLSHAFVLVDAFEEAEDFPGFFGGLWG
jgi:hypothetical protein